MPDAETHGSKTSLWIARIATAWLLLVALASLAAPWIAPFDPIAQLDPVAARLLPPGSERVLVELPFETRAAERVDVSGDAGDQIQLERLGRVETVDRADVRSIETRRFLLGTDRFGRDVASRALYGARLSLTIGLASLLLAMTVGVAVGAAAALGGPIVDAVLMRLVDALLAFPWIFLLIALSALFVPGPTTLVLLLGGTSWGGVARLARAEIASLRRREFVLAAHGLGIPPVRVFMRHILPHAATPLVVTATLRIAGLILIEASLSFLGFGVPVPLPSWGNMIAEARYDPVDAWWLLTVPSLALVSTVFAVHLAADAARDVLDPRAA